MAKYHYMAKAAHLAVMAELAARDYNVAMPEIDIGDDICAVNDTSGNFWRVQVKYGKLKVQKKSIAAIFSCREDQLQKPDTPELYYVFVFRTDDGWRYVVFSRDSLNTHYKSNGFGTRFIQKKTQQPYVNFRVTVSGASAWYGSGRDRKDVSSQISKWTDIPHN